MLPRTDLVQLRRIPRRPLRLDETREKVVGIVVPEHDAVDSAARRIGQHEEILVLPALRELVARGEYAQDSF